MTQQKSVVDWLRDAHAMEAGGVVTLTDHAEAAGDYPEVAAKLREHASATRRHAELLEGRLAALGTGPSSLKEAVGAAFSKVAGVANLPAGDTVIKNALGDLAAENFEIASYLSLIAAAETVGDRETAAVCGQILHDEESMAAWLKAQIPSVTQQFLARQAGSEGGAAGGGRLESAKETVRNVGERVKDAAPDAGDTRNALLVSGALLAGAGAALLVGKALLGGSEGRRGERYEESEGPGEPARAPAPDVQPDTHPDVQPGLAADSSAPSEASMFTDEVTSDVPAEPVALAETLSDLSRTDPNTTDLSDTGLSGTDLNDTDLSGTGLNGTDLNDAGLIDAGLIDASLNGVGNAGVAASQDELVAETVGGDAAFLRSSEASSAEAQATSGEAISAETVSAETVSAETMSAETTSGEAAAPELHDGSQSAAAPADAEEEESSDAAGTGGDGLWRVPGPFSGLGPQGRNGASGPLGEVYERLTQHGHVDATHVEVALRGDRVRLGGSVDSESTKRLALAAVRGVPGVADVEDALEVRVTDGV